jgi:hypothetical protein
MRENHYAYKKCDMMFGAVLARLCRSDRPTTSRLISTKPDERRKQAVYQINDAVIYMKYDSKSQQRERKKCEQWQFTFTGGNLDEINDRVQKLKPREEFFLVLICVRYGYEGEVCLLNLDNIRELLDLSSGKQQVIYVEDRDDRRGLQVYISRNREQPITIYKSCLDDWNIPGS